MKTQALQKVREELAALHNDERGDIPVGPIMLIGLVVIPLVIGLVAFGDVLTDWFQEQWDRITGTDTGGLEDIN